MYPAITSTHVYIRIEKLTVSPTPIRREQSTMTDLDNDQRARKIVAAGTRARVPISEKHAELAATWGESLDPAFEAVRAIDYQQHEPSNVFNPVALAGGSDGGNER